MYKFGCVIEAPYSTRKIDGDIVHLSASERAVAAGQSAVIYDGDECLGGGIVKTD